MGLLSDIRNDFTAALERDPAARGLGGALAVLLCYPGVKAVIAYRLLHRLSRVPGLLLPARVLSQMVRFFTGTEIHPSARIGRGLFIDHAHGVVIGETTIIGDNVTLYQGVTLGGTGKQSGKRHPTVGDNVVIGAGAKVLGAITLGDGARVGAGSVVVRDVPPGCTVVGVPAIVVRRDGRRVGEVILDHTDLPNPLIERLGELERELSELQDALRIERRRADYGVGDHDDDAARRGRGERRREGSVEEIEAPCGAGGPR